MSSWHLHLSLSTVSATPKPKPWKVNLFIRHPSQAASEAQIFVSNSTGGSIPVDKAAAALVCHLFSIYCQGNWGVRFHFHLPYTFSRHRAYNRARNPQFSPQRPEFDTKTCSSVYLNLSWQFSFHQVPYSDIYQLGMWWHWGGGKLIQWPWSG